MIHCVLFWEFFKVGLFVIGGGQATIPFLTDMAERTEWFTVEELIDMIAIAESTPGPIGVNMATYVGYKILGIIGSLVSTLGLVCPSIIIILIVARVLQQFKHSKYLAQLFYAIRPASTGLIGAALCTLLMLCLFDINLLGQTGLFIDLINIKYMIFFAVLVILTNIKKIKNLHPVIFVALAAVVGIVFKF